MKYIIFDFDGTIADTFTVVEEIGNSILKQYGIKINSEAAKQIGLRQTIIKSKFPKWTIPQVLRIPIIAVTWGYNTGDNLIKEKPTFIADNSREILEYIPKIL